MAMSGTRPDAALAISVPGPFAQPPQGVARRRAISSLTVQYGRQRFEGNETIDLPEATQETDAQPEDIPLEIIFEDEHLIIINKPPGLVVHPGAGNRKDAAQRPAASRPGACQRRPCRYRASARQGHQRRHDGGAHAAGADASGRQLQTHAASREYVALVHGAVRKSGTVEGAIGRHGRDRTKMAMVVVGGKPAVTHYKLRESFGGAAMLGKHYSLLECKLETGRTHQIPRTSGEHQAPVGG